MKIIVLFLLLLSLLCTACGAKPSEEGSGSRTEGESAASEDGGDESETEDHVLLTLEAPLADGRTLTLEAFGAVWNEYECGVREVRIYDGEDLLQTIVTQEAIEAFWGQGMEETFYTYTTCWSPEQSMEALDLNFDGNTDFGLFGWSPNNTIPYYYWQWDPAAEQYRYAFILQGGMADPLTKEFSSEYKAGDGGSQYVVDYYQPGEDGQLYLVRQEITDYVRTQDSNRPSHEVWTVREGLRLLPNAPGGPQEGDLVLTRRDLPVMETGEDGTAVYYTEVWELVEDEFQLTSREEFSYET